MIGDLNSKDEEWGCRANNPAGSTLKRLASQNSFIIQGPREYTYYPNRLDQLPDILDIVCHKNMNFPMYQTVIPELESDHLPVIVSFYTAPSIVKSRPTLIKGKIDWEKFQNKINIKLKAPNNLLSNVQIDRYVEKFTIAIQNSVIESTIKIDTRPYSKPVTPPYIINKIKEKTQIRRQWQRTRHPILKTKLNQLTHEIKRLLDAYTTKSYQDFVEELKPQDNSLWRVVKKLAKEPLNIIPSINYENRTHTTDEEKCRAFSKHLYTVFTPHSSPTDNEPNLDEERIENQPTGNINPTSPNEIKDIIKNLKNRKSPGHDLITNTILKKLGNKAIAFLATFYNACLRIGYFPKSWKEAQIIVFHKPGKPKNDVKSYRPISLLPTLSKVFEKIILTRLNTFLEENNTIPQFQFGFKKFHSAVHQSMRLTQFIEEGYENKEYVVTSFMDIEQAFDRVWKRGLIHKVKKIGTPDYLSMIIESFLDERRFSVLINGVESQKQEINAGVPQGSILGPILFNIYMSDIPAIEQSAVVSMFADDTVIMAKNADINLAIENLQKATDTICKWLVKWKFKINQAKCVTKVFTLRKIPNGIQQIGVNNTPILWNRPDQPVKYLGVYLDSRLTFKYHVGQRLQQFHNALLKLYPIINRKSSLKTSYGLLIYKSILRPILTYACPAWMSASKTTLKKLQVAQNKILRILTDAPWFVRNKQLHSELGLSEMEVFIRCTAKNFFDRIHQCEGAITFNIGQKNIHVRLKRRLPQDLL